MMNLFFLRHGQAHPRGPRWHPDSRRPLTREGVDNMFDVARGLRALKVEFDVILTSPHARALRTAEILAEVHDAPAPRKTDSLTPDANAAGLIDEIDANFSRAGGLVLVGHEPGMSRLISMLLTGDEGVALELKKAGLCKLTTEKLFFGKCARLHWLLTAKQLAKLGKQR